MFRSTLIREVVGELANRLEVTETGEALLSVLDPERNEVDREVTVIVPLSEIDTDAPSGPSTPENLVTWMLRDLLEEVDVRSEATHFILASGMFVSLTPVRYETETDLNKATRPIPPR